MLAGILISIVVVAGLAIALPWVLSQKSSDLELEDDPAERFSNSVRILRRDVEDYQDEDTSAVSTPLTRRAELHELRMIARQAARRRMVVVCALLAAVVCLVVLSAIGVTPWWSIAIPGGLLAAFLVVARFSVVGMHRNLDRRSKAVERGFDDDEDTETIDLTDFEGTESIEISVDLSMPTTTGMLWEPIPVTPATYVSQPLLPRTVRTIDLSAPTTASTPVVPTADNPADEVRESSGEATGPQNIAQFRPRAMGE